MIKTLLLDQTNERRREGKEKMLNHPRNHPHKKNHPKVAMDVEEPIVDDVVNGADQPQDDATPKQEQTSLNDIVNVEKDSLTFDELMATPIDFSKFAMNCLKLDKITKADLWRPKRQIFYKSQVNRLSRHDVYSTIKILSVVSVKVDKKYSYEYLEEIVVRRADRKLYTFKDGDFPNLHLNDIEDMLLLHVQNKLFNLDGDNNVDLAVALRMLTRRIFHSEKG
ncbi:hypothetical protein Tco_0132324 [Tanacetum coccineum]